MPKNNNHIVFDVCEYPDVYRNLSSTYISQQFAKTLQYAIDNSENVMNGPFGTVMLADGREARVSVTIEAATIKDTASNSEAI